MCSFKLPHRAAENRRGFCYHLRVNAEAASEIERFLAYLSEERVLAPTTVAAYGGDLRALLNHLNSGGEIRSLTTLTAEELGEHLHGERERSIAESSLRRKLAALRVFLAWAGAEELIARHPLAEVSLPRRGEPLPRALSREVVDRLLAETNRRVELSSQRLAEWSSSEEQRREVKHRRLLTELVLIEQLNETKMSLTAVLRLTWDEVAPDDQRLQSLRDSLNSPVEGAVFLDKKGEPLRRTQFASRLQTLSKLAGLAESLTPKQLREHAEPLLGYLRRELAELSNSDETGSSSWKAHHQALRNSALLELLYSAGLRVSEALGLRWRGLDLRSGYARVLGKGGKQRIVPLGETAVGRLKQLQKLRNSPPPAEVIFINAQGKALRRGRVNRLLAELAEAAGISPPPSPHQLRHSFATHLLAGGAGIRLVNELLGHSRLTETQRYTRVEVSHLSEAHKKAHPRSGQS